MLPPLPPAVITPDLQHLAKTYMALRADGISIVVQAERALEAIGCPVPTAVRDRQERREEQRDNAAKTEGLN